MIRFENASVTYGGGVHTLKDLSLEIADSSSWWSSGCPAPASRRWCRAINGLVPLSVRWP